MRRVVLASWLAVGLALCAAHAASAVTLKLHFLDSQPMTYGSACSGEGCMQRNVGVVTTDANGEVRLADVPDRTIEYRRHGIDLATAPPGDASGSVRGVGERASAVLPRLLRGSAPAVDAIESEVVARINEARSAHGLPAAQLNVRLSTAADFQATWLSSSAVGLMLPVVSHTGPFGSTPAFRLGEVSFPEPATGAEIAAAGWTPAEALVGWLASPPHRDKVLAPGALLIGVARVGSVTIVTTHPPCSGRCEQAAHAGGSGAGAPAPGGTPAGPGAPAMSGSASDRALSCGAERLRVKRLPDRLRRLRLRVGLGCLRRDGGYTLNVSQGPPRRGLTTRRIAGPGTITLALRPRRNTRTLRIELRHRQRVVAARSIARRPAGRP